MIATLTFNLEDSEDRMAHFRCVKALDMACALHEIAYNLHRSLEDNAETDNIQSFRDKMFMELDKHGINLDELIV